MSQDNCQLAHEVIDAVEQRDLSSLIQLTDPDVEWHSAFAVFRGKGSGVAGESESGYVLRFQEGRVVSFRPFRDPEAALGAVGLNDQ